MVLTYTSYLTYFTIFSECTYPLSYTCISMVRRMACHRAYGMISRTCERSYLTCFRIFSECTYPLSFISMVPSRSVWNDVPYMWEIVFDLFWNLKFVHIVFVSEQLPDDLQWPLIQAEHCGRETEREEIWKWGLCIRQKRKKISGVPILRKF